MTILSTAGIKVACFRVIAAVLACLFLAGCTDPFVKPSPPETPNLAPRVAELDAKQAELDRAAENLNARQSKLEAREKKLVATEQELARQQQQLAALEKSMQVAEFRAKLEPAPSPVTPPGILVLGELEQVFLEPPGIILSARIDTGSEISSLHALNITEFERDGKPYVQFSIPHPETDEQLQLTRRVRDHVRIKELNGKSQKHPVVLLRAVLGEIDERIRFSLVDRNKFAHPVMIGRNLLRDLAIVDVSQQYTTNPEIE